MKPNAIFRAATIADRYSTTHTGDEVGGEGVASTAGVSPRHPVLT